MKDFLAGLVDRAFDSASVLQRRRPSLFEPAPDLGAWGGSHSRVLTEEKSEDADAPEQRLDESGRSRPPKMAEAHRAAPVPSARQPRSPQPVSVGKEPSNGNPTIQSAGKTEHVRAARPAPDTLPSAVVTVTRTRRAMETIVEAPAARHQLQPRPSVVLPDRPTVKNDTAPASAKPAAATVGPITPAIAASDRPDVIKRRTKPDSDRVERNSEPRMASVTRPVPLPLPRADTRRSGRAQPAMVREAVPAAPTIHVTIGRIEVRAMPAPVASAKPPRSRAPALGLDEYLRRRNGGAS